MVGEPNAGVASGVMMTPSSISVKDQTRADARRGYFDKVISRRNLHVATEQQVTRLILNSMHSFNRTKRINDTLGVSVSGVEVRSIRGDISASVD